MHFFGSSLILTRFCWVVDYRSSEVTNDTSYQVILWTLKPLFSRVFATYFPLYWESITILKNYLEKLLCSTWINILMINVAKIKQSHYKYVIYILQLSTLYPSQTTFLEYPRVYWKKLCRETWYCVNLANPLIYLFI